MGLLVDVGTRDETGDDSGALLAIKNTYLKTQMKSNEVTNFGLMQMTGGALSMEYDQEKTYYKSQCIEYDVADVFDMMINCALEPKSEMSGQIARSKNQKSHDLFEQLSKFDPFASQ